MRFPSIPTFLSAVFRFSKRPETVPLAIELTRGDICTFCDFNENDQCQKCTCFIPLKIKFSTESCPEQKWGEYHNRNKNGLR